MPDQPGQDKTEKATPRRREEARKEGNVAKSMDVNSVAVLLMGVVVLKYSGRFMLEGIAEFMKTIYTTLSVTSLTVETVPAQARSGILHLLMILTPVLGMIMFAGLAANLAQVGIGLSPKALKPKFNKINPLKGFKRLASAKSLMELIKGVVKILIVGGVGYSVISGHLQDYFELGGQTTWMILLFISSVLFELAIKIAGVLIFLAAADYAWQKFDFEKNLKMTKQEIKDEMKQFEGNPEIKSRIRAAQKEASRNRMMQAVPDATVVVTNPTHIAVALLYDPKNKQDAPKVIAKGQRKTAERIKEIATEHGVPIIEDKPLARTLFKTIEVGMEIPSVFFKAVAEILAQVYRMQRNDPSLKQRIKYGE